MAIFGYKAPTVNNIRTRMETQNQISRKDVNKKTPKLTMTTMMIMLGKIMMIMIMSMMMSNMMIRRRKTTMTMTMMITINRKAQKKIKLQKMLRENAQIFNFNRVELRKFLNKNVSFWILNQVLTSVLIEKGVYTPNEFAFTMVQYCDAVCKAYGDHKELNSKKLKDITVMEGQVGKLLAFAFGVDCSAVVLAETADLQSNQKAAFKDKLAHHFKTAATISLVTPNLQQG